MKLKRIKSKLKNEIQTKYANESEKTKRFRDLLKETNDEEQKDFIRMQNAQFGFWILKSFLLKTFKRLIAHFQCLFYALLSPLIIHSRRQDSLGA